MHTLGTFQRANPLPGRLTRSAACRSRNKPARIPVILEHSAQVTRPSLILLKSEFLVPADLTVAEFLFKLRASLQGHIRPETAVYLMAGGTMVLPSMEMGAVDAEFADAEDGWLYLVWAEESTFG